MHKKEALLNLKYVPFPHLCDPQHLSITFDLLSYSINTLGILQCAPNKPFFSISPSLPQRSNSTCLIALVKSSLTLSCHSWSGGKTYWRYLYIQPNSPLPQTVFTCPVPVIGIALHCFYPDPHTTAERGGRNPRTESQTVLTQNPTLLFFSCVTLVRHHCGIIFIYKTVTVIDSRACYED